MDIVKSSALEAYRKSMGNIAHACRTVGIVRQTFYNWMENDPEFAQAVDDAKEEAIDVVETQLMKLINEGNVVAILFFLKTRAKARGYVERSELTGPEGRKIEVTHTYRLPDGNDIQL